VAPDQGLDASQRRSVGRHLEQGCSHLEISPQWRLPRPRLAAGESRPFPNIVWWAIIPSKQRLMLRIQFASDAFPNGV
jgi:hypothetical protein